MSPKLPDEPEDAPKHQIAIVVRPGECLIVRCFHCDTPNVFFINPESASPIASGAEKEGVEMNMKCAKCNEFLLWYKDRIFVVPLRPFVN